MTLLKTLMFTWHRTGAGAEEERRKKRERTLTMAKPLRLTYTCLQTGAGAEEKQKKRKGLYQTQRPYCEKQRGGRERRWFGEEFDWEGGFYGTRAVGY